MTRLPVVSGRECIRALEQVGYAVVRQKGSHIMLWRDDPVACVVVPNHNELDRGTLRSIIRQAGLTVEQFVNLL
jgi:predicted RNA binding protein YcfA (HicA-like mRNA interferase family)